MPLEKYWEPSKYEKEIYKKWEESGAFVADSKSDKPPFVISMPPPNATGTLHSGHAVMLAIEDVMCRFKRMQGHEVLWLPGTDHAAIATESVVIRKLQDEGMSDPRRTLGREGLLAEIAAFVEKSQNRIRTQIRAMGSSCDWSRERYTMDPQLNRCVNAIFARMFRDGLIYRGPRIVNWDPALQTTVSDDEIYHEERAAKFYTIRYGPFLVGTSRPETKLGDTGLAVHPEDIRYQEHIGKTYEVKWPKGPTIQVKVVADRAVDPQFGTGVLGVTPAHSQVDFEIASRHELPLVQVIGEDGCMTAAAGVTYAGMKVHQCRLAFVEDLRAAGLLEEVRDYQQSVSLCYRSKKPIEPLPKAQWFINVDEPGVLWQGRQLSIKQVLREVVAKGDIRIVPEYQTKSYFHWIDNLRDWCISRQIWWGHRIPVYYRGEEDIYVGHRAPEGEGWRQDEDTLDTWFSSALWTWSTLVDPELAKNEELDLSELLRNSPDFQKFHPTTVMETGYDILFFWVARMILMTTYATGQVPFKVVYLHGLVLDRNGDKMSKSKPETCIDPLEIIEKHGADVMRLALLLGSSAGQDLKLGGERLVGCQRLVTKIWNAAKLVSKVGDRASYRDGLAGSDSEFVVTHPINRYILARVSDTHDLVCSRLDRYAFGDAADLVRQVFWADFCDFYLEAIKEDSLSALKETPGVVRKSFGMLLQMFHPFIPYLTEFLWANLEISSHSELLAASRWLVNGRIDRDSDHRAVEILIRLVECIRGAKAKTSNLPAGYITCQIRLLEPKKLLLLSCVDLVSRLSRIEDIQFVQELPEGPLATNREAHFEVALISSCRTHLPENSGRQNRKELVQSKLTRLEGMLLKEDFGQRAKATAIQRIRQQIESLRREIVELEKNL